MTQRTNHQRPNHNRAVYFIGGTKFGTPYQTDAREDRGTAKVVEERNFKTLAVIGEMGPRTTRALRNARGVQVFETIDDLMKDLCARQEADELVMLYGPMGNAKAPNSAHKIATLLQSRVAGSDGWYEDIKRGASQEAAPVSPEAQTVG